MTVKNQLYSYKAFGLLINSAFPVTGFVPLAFNAEPDVTIEKGDVPASLNNVCNKGVFYQANTNEFLLKIEGIGGFYASNGNKIIVEKSKAASWNDINVFLVGRVFGSLLQQRRLLTLHASAVRFNGCNFIFAGHSGSGKSTLTAAFIDKGAYLLADDIVTISLLNDNPMIIPSFPVIKIWEDSLLSLGKDPSEYKPVRDGYRKYYLPVSNFIDEPYNPEFIITLHTHNSESFESDVLSGVEKFSALRSFTYFIRGIAHTGIEVNHFELCNRLALQTKIIKLTRPNGTINMPPLIEKIISAAGI
jgi:hypothetical protein